MLEGIRDKLMTRVTRQDFRFNPGMVEPSLPLDPHNSQNKYFCFPNLGDGGTPTRPWHD